MNVPQIVNNPLRVLGVYANSTLREIEQNKAQLRAFARVGQKVELPLWLKGLSLLPPMPDITEEMLTQAQSQISLQEDREDYARFWFEKDESFAQEDEKVFSLLSKDKVRKARKLWEQRTDHAAMKNLLLLAVMESDWKKIAEYSSKSFEGNEWEFAFFMNEVIKASVEANSSRSHWLLSYFKQEQWKTAMKEYLIGNHKRVLEADIEKMKKIYNSYCDDLPLLKKDIREVAEDFGHVNGLKYLCGEESVMTLYYSTTTGMLLCQLLFTYGYRNEDKEEVRWASNLMEQLIPYVGVDSNDSKNLLLHKEILDTRVGKSFRETMSGCMLYLIWVIFILAMVRACTHGDSSYDSPMTRDRLKRYKYVDPSTYTIDFEKIQKQIEYQKNYDSLVNVIINKEKEEQKQLEEIVKDINIQQMIIDKHQSDSIK